MSLKFFSILCILFLVFVLICIIPLIRDIKYTTYAIRQKNTPRIVKKNIRSNIKKSYRLN